MRRQLAPAFRMMLAMTVLTGLLYPPLVTGLCQLSFRHQAGGSLVRAGGRIVGSSLIGQNFTRPGDFQPRPSAAGNGYDASNSGASNYGPTSRELMDRIANSIRAFRKANPDYTGPIPSDLVTASASGLDPDISLASAEAQAPRVAAARQIPRTQLLRFIQAHAEYRRFGFLGEPLVNVLELNLALDRLYPLRRRDAPSPAAAAKQRPVEEARSGSQPMAP
ncbi:MAG TPA: potassium-transporting ATPase subunit KdpC [Patescibacteria group bacterium]|nr:potassium-transporting ATPase subunit KdpC [Patescibacteria group bacterium]